MAEISAAMVKQLRGKTGAGIMDCKEALSECKGDIDQAVDFLRKKGLATAKKRAGRATRSSAGVSPASASAAAVASPPSPTASRPAHPPHRPRASHRPGRRTLISGGLSRRYSCALVLV